MPAAVYQLLSDQYLKGAILVVFVFAISLNDNLLHPPLIGNGIRLPDYVVLVSTLRGIALFSITDFVICPMIVRRRLVVIARQSI